jgi:hypothetical protein
MGATARLTERFDPRLGRSRFRWARRSVVIDPLPPVVTGRFRAIKSRNFPKNEHWHWCVLESNPCAAMLAVP